MASKTFEGAMKRLFHVGQRVKIIRAAAFPHVVGAHATITGIANNGDDWRVEIDGHPCPKPAPYYTAKESGLEPIYDGDQKSAWDEKIWMPEPLRKVRETA